jgi:hypothetical protein
MFHFARWIDLIEDTAGKLCEYSAVVEVGLVAPLQVPSPCNIQRDDGSISSLEFLAPVHLRAFVGAEYPASAPTFTLECPWLTLKQLSGMWEGADGRRSCTAGAKASP